MVEAAYNSQILHKTLSSCKHTAEPAYKIRKPAYKFPKAAYKIQKAAYKNAKPAHKRGISSMRKALFSLISLKGTGNDRKITIY